MTTLTGAFRRRFLGRSAEVAASRGATATG